MPKKHPQPEQPTETPDYKELYQRSLADQENSRRRLDQDKQLFTRFALEGFMSDLLPVIDNFYRATEHIPLEQQQAGWVTGVLYIQKQLLDTLEKRGISEISAKVGDHFNPSEHEAIGITTDQSVGEDSITEIKNKGYKLHDRVLRPVQVIVNKHSQQ